MAVFFISNNSATFSLRQKDNKILEILSKFGHSKEELPICSPLNLNTLPSNIGIPKCSIRLSKNFSKEDAYSGLRTQLLMQMYSK